MAKNAIYKKLIHTTKWLKLRKQVLTDHPLCQRCLEQGVTTPAVEVHHIVPAETAINQRDMSALMYDYHNLRALCHNCHVLTHAEMGRSGKEARRKRNDEQLNQFVKKYIQTDDSKKE